MWMPRSLRSQSQTLFWWKFSGQVIDQKEEHCTGIVFLLQKRGDTSDTEVRLAHGSMRHSSLKKLPYRLVLVLLTFYFRCLGLDFFLKKIRFRIGRDSPYFLGIRKTVHVRSKTSSTRSGACFFPLFFSNKYVSLSRICLTCHRNNSLYNSCLGRESLKFKHNLFQLYR